ncbi:hypothetical protein BJ742DRAFT_796433 [Cladochytrium replicatum]|nr:hypothetical protein BJ742DRAFT_796433 [Cladochytrium replicatum]
MEQAKKLWEPSHVHDTEMARFQQFVSKKTRKLFEGYHDLWKWSVDDISGFWAAVWDYTGIIHSTPYERVVEEDVRMDKIPKWFKGARLNYAENVLKHRDDHAALICTGEQNTYSVITYAELYKRVAECSAAMRAAGIKKGDRVAAYIPNCSHAVVAMLATSSIGAIWSSASPDFGVTGVVERFAQIEPRILFSVNAVVYNGKTWDHLEKLRAVIDGLPTVEKVIVIPFVQQSFDISSVKKGVHYDDFIAGHAGTKEIGFEQLPFDHPIFILYSSGTTGKPKCIVHSAGGVLIQHLKEHIIHSSMKREDVFFYYTTTGWMMWNWLVSGLLVGSTIVLYDGSPFKPTPYRLWEVAEQHKVTLFGTSAKYIQSLQEGSIEPAAKHNLSSIRVLFSTGSPLTPESFDYVFKSIKQHLVLGSITGGTDIVSLFAGHNSALPVYRGEVQCRMLGMFIEAWDEKGSAIYDEAGDLICKRPFPCMPVYFWDDKDGQKYFSAYFAQYEGIWYHGDFMSVSSKTGGVVMLGRSDGTLNPGGVRFGSAELYNIVDTFPEILDSLAVGQKISSDDERVVLFLKMRDGETFSEDIASKIKAKIRSLLSPRHVPSVILPIADIPYTLTGKKVEIAVKKIISGATVVPSGALANPDVLQLYYNLPELKLH